MKQIAIKKVGSKLMMGVEWPIENVLQRLGPGSWQIVYHRCNGIAKDSKQFKTLREAREEFEKDDTSQETREDFQEDCLTALESDKR